jgi:hypothetical protein
MLITFDLPHVFDSDSSTRENAEALSALLECLVAIDLAYLGGHVVPPLYRSGVVYGRTETWDPIPAVLTKGFGDCKSLSAWLVASRRRESVPTKPVFRWFSRPDGIRDFHILVETDAGFEDPSKVLGMPIGARF